MKRILLVAVVLVTLVAQLGVIGYFADRNERLLREGVECRFACQAYDPHDPFRGKYLRVSVTAEFTDLSVFGLGDDVREEDFRTLSDRWIRIDPQGGRRGLSRIVACADEPSGTGVWTRVKSVSPTFVLSYSDRREKEDWKAFEKRRRASGVKGTAELPSRYFISERLAAEAEDAINSGSGRMVAVYRVGGGRIVLTGIEIDGQPIDQFVKAERRLRPESSAGLWKGFADTADWAKAVHDDPDIRTWARFNREVLRPFLEREIVDRFKQGPDASNPKLAKFPEAVGRVLDGLWEKTGRGHATFLDNLRWQVSRDMGMKPRDLRALPLVDPTLRVIVALQQEKKDALATLDRLDAELGDEASVPRFLSAWTRAMKNQKSHSDETIHSPDATNLTQAAVALFEKYAAEPEITRAIHYLLTPIVAESHQDCNSEFAGFWDADRANLVRQLEASKADPWIAAVVRADLEADRGWDAGGHMRPRDKEVWETKVRPHWVKARELYSKAWQMHPELPEGPTGAMICEWKLGNVRATDLWMGHVYQAEIDNPQTYRLMRGEMIGGFGVGKSSLIETYKACERHDTMLTAFVVDMMPWGSARELKDQDLREEIVRLALTQVTNANAVSRMRGTAAFKLCNATYAGGDWEKTIEYGRKFRTDASYTPDPVKDVRELFSVADTSLIEVERNIRTGAVEVARSELERRGRGPKLGFHEALYVTNALKRIAVLQKRDPAVYEEDDKKLMDVPFSLDDEWRELAIAPKSSLWFCGTYLKKAAGGGFALDTKMDSKSRDSAHSTQCWRRISPDFECELELEFPDPKKGGVCALRIPVPRSTSGGFAQVSVTNGMFRAGGYYVGTHSRSIWKFLNPSYGEELGEQPKNGKVTMRVRVQDKRLSQWVNDRQTVFDWYVPAWKDPNFDEYTHVALLGGGVVVKRIRLRRVPVEVK